MREFRCSNDWTKAKNNNGVSALAEVYTVELVFRRPAQIISPQLVWTTLSSPPIHRQIHATWRHAP